MDLAALIAIDEIKQFKSRYLRRMDQLDRDAWAALFTDDAVIEVTHAGKHIRWEGRDAIVPGKRARNTGVTSIHHGHTPEDGAWKIGRVKLDLHPGNAPAAGETGAQGR